MESILTSIKKLLGIGEECDDFDSEIIIHINSVFSDLNGIGGGPSEGFSIEDDSVTWDAFLTMDNPARFNSVKTYMYLKVRLLFDPPQSSTVIENFNKKIDELTWRLNVTAENTSVQS